MTYRILCTDGFAKTGLEELEKDANLEVVFKDKLSHDELLETIDGFDGLIVRSASNVGRDVIERGTTLKVVARAGVGIDNIDLEAATERGIMVVNAPAGNTTSTAELSFTMLLSLARRIPQAAKLMSEGTWEKKGFKGNEVAHKTLGIIGMGRIGREVAKRARAFEMNVMGMDPFLPEEQFASLGITKASLEEILKEADYITIHSPLTPETENMITAREIAMMKPTAYIINCARGGIVNEHDLANALREKRIAGAALDVYTQEPFKETIFQGLDNCVLTPHLGASTAEAQDAVAVEAAAAVAQYFREGLSPNAVNLQAGGADAWQKFRSHIALAEKLGSLAAQLGEGNAKRITLVSDKGLPRLIALSAIKGVLGSTSEDQITFVNAETAARERGIAIAEELVSTPAVFSDSFGAKIASSAGEIEVWGAVLADGKNKITSIEGWRVEIDPEGTILFIHNADRPGVIGKVATVLGECGINIAEMQNVRRSQGSEALTIIGVDGEVTKEAIGEIAHVEGVTAVKLVHL